MGLIFWLFGCLSGLLTVLLLALALSSGLYLLAELAEEYPSMAGKITKYLMIAVLVVHLILLIDGLPFFETAFGIASHLIYASMLKNFPFVDFYSLSSVGSVIGFFASNVLWLRHFIDDPQEPFHVVGFFVVAVWLIPCALFVSLTMSENSLPSAGIQANSFAVGGKKNNSILKSLLDWVLEQFESFTKLGIFQSLSNKRK